jgi:hypothetical protein
VSEPTDPLARAIAGALRAAIRDHGPITLERIASATKRILGQLRNAGASALGAALVRKRWAGKTAEQRAAEVGGIASSGGKAAWRGMSAKARSDEMRRRAQKRARAAVLSSGRAGPSGSGGAR